MSGILPIVDAALSLAASVASIIDTKLDRKYSEQVLELRTIIQHEESLPYFCEKVVDASGVEQVVCPIRYRNQERIDKCNRRITNLMAVMSADLKGLKL